MEIKLKNIEAEEDIKFLYVLLEERPTYANISHKQMPTYEQHKAFVNSKPYDIWFIIWNNNNRVGSIYKTKPGEIGIFVKKEFQHQGIAKTAIPMIYNLGVEKNIANVSPLNPKSITLFEKLGFKHIQNTYQLEEE